MSWGGSAAVIYECKRCGGKMSEDDLESRGGHVKCIFCGFRVVVKTKPPVVHRCKAI